MFSIGARTCTSREAWFFCKIDHQSKAAFRDLFNRRQSFQYCYQQDDCSAARSAHTRVLACNILRTFAPSEKVVLLQRYGTMEEMNKIGRKHCDGCLASH
jgi:hypothetical protein